MDDVLNAANSQLDETSFQIHRLVMIMVKALVDVPDAVTVEVMSGAEQTTFRLAVHPTGYRKGYRETRTHGPVDAYHLKRL